MTRCRLRLAEYNAGRHRAAKWAGEKDDGGTGPANPGASSRELVANIDIPSTRHYVETVQSRVRFIGSAGSFD